MRKNDLTYNEKSRQRDLNPQTTGLQPVEPTELLFA